MAMNHRGGQFLAGPSLTRDQRAALGRGYLKQILSDLAQRPAVPNHFNVAAPIAGAGIASARNAHATADAGEQVSNRHRFFEIIGASRAQRRDRQFFGTLRRDQDHRQMGPLRHHHLRRAQAIMRRAQSGTDYQQAGAVVFARLLRDRFRARQLNHSEANRRECRTDVGAQLIVALSKQDRRFQHHDPPKRRPG